MPLGRETLDKRWFQGWYEVVIQPAIQEAGFEPILVAHEPQPGAINDEIRTHLAYDQMVVVDLGGVDPEDEPNPNVMYELGIRHALSLPLVIMAWKDQTLPFDVSNQRAIMEERDFKSIELNKRRLVSFIKSAVEGNYYRPMEAVARLATIQAASEEDTLLGALAQEVRDLKISIEARTTGGRTSLKLAKPRSVRELVGPKASRKRLYTLFLGTGTDERFWGKVLETKVPPSEAGEMKVWPRERWDEYVIARALEFANQPIPSRPSVDEDVVDRVRDALPAQPFPKGTHREIAGKLGISVQDVHRSVGLLYKRGVLQKQISGERAYTESNSYSVEEGAASTFADIASTPADQEGGFAADEQRAREDETVTDKPAT